MTAMMIVVILLTLVVMSMFLLPFLLFLLFLVLFLSLLVLPLHVLSSHGFKCVFICIESKQRPTSWIYGNEKESVENVLLFSKNVRTKMIHCACVKNRSERELFGLPINSCRSVYEPLDLVSFTSEVVAATFFVVARLLVNSRDGDSFDSGNSVWFAGGVFVVVSFSRADDSSSSPLSDDDSVEFVVEIVSFLENFAEIMGAVVTGESVVGPSLFLIALSDDTCGTFTISSRKLFFFTFSLNTELPNITVKHSSIKIANFSIISQNFLLKFGLIESRNFHFGWRDTRFSSMFMDRMQREHWNENDKVHRAL